MLRSMCESDDPGIMMVRIPLEIAVALLAVLLTAAPPAGAQAPLPAGFVDAAEHVEGLVVDMRYYGTNNFVGDRIDGYERAALPADGAGGQGAGGGAARSRARAGSASRCSTAIGRRAPSLISCAGRKRIDDVQQQGRVLSRRRQARSVQARLHRQPLRPFARLDGRHHGGAPRGPAPSSTWARRYDFSGPQSWLSDKSVSLEAQQNRALFVAAMTRGGFTPYQKEWWHFTLADEPFPQTYFDFPVR